MDYVDLWVSYRKYLNTFVFNGLPWGWREDSIIFSFLEKPLPSWQIFSSVTVLRKQSHLMSIEQLIGHQLFGYFRFDIRAMNSKYLIKNESILKYLKNNNFDIFIFWTFSETDDIWHFRPQSNLVWPLRWPNNGKIRFLTHKFWVKTFEWTNKMNQFANNWKITVLNNFLFFKYFQKTMTISNFRNGSVQQHLKNKSQLFLLNTSVCKNKSLWYTMQSHVLSKLIYFTLLILIMKTQRSLIVPNYEQHHVLLPKYLLPNLP